MCPVFHYKSSAKVKIVIVPMILVYLKKENKCQVLVLEKYKVLLVPGLKMCKHSAGLRD